MTEDGQTTRERYRAEYGPVPSRTSLQDQLDHAVLQSVLKHPVHLTSVDITGDPSRGTSIRALARAHQARRLHPDISSDLALHRFLARNQDQLEALGFEPDADGTVTPPSREAIRRFRTERVSEDWLEHVAYATIGVADALGVEYGYDSLKRESDDYFRPPKLVSTNEIQSAYEMLTPYLDEHLQDGRDEARSWHPWSVFKDILGEASAQKTSCSDVITDRQRPEQKQKYELVEPHENNEKGDISIKGFFDGLDANSATKYMKCFEHIFHAFLEEANANGMFNRPVDLMIDGTDFIFNPKKWRHGSPVLPKGVVGTRNGEYAYKFITVSVYDRENNKTMKPISFPMRDRGHLFIAVAYIIRMLKPYINIREVFADSEFASGPILNFLQDRNIDYCLFKPEALVYLLRAPLPSIRRGPNHHGTNANIRC